MPAGTPHIRCFQIGRETSNWFVSDMSELGYACLHGSKKLYDSLQTRLIRHLNLVLPHSTPISHIEYGYTRRRRPHSSTYLNAAHLRTQVGPHSYSSDVHTPLKTHPCCRTPTTFNFQIDYGGLGDDLAARGERQIRSSAGCCGGVSKLREGEKLMKSACDQYQTAKQWKKRGETYAKLVALLDEYEGPLKTDKNKIADYHTYAARSFAEAEVYSRAFEHYRAAALVLQIANEYRAAAGVLTELADTYIDAGDKEGAISALNDAADAYDMANSPSSAYILHHKYCFAIIFRFTIPTPA